MFTNTRKIKIWSAAASLALIAFASFVPQVEAVVLDSNIYGQFQTLRTRLLSKEADLLRDYDAIQKKIDLLHKHQDPSLTPTIDGLSKALDQAYSDLRKVRQDIKTVELQML